jgi:integrase
MALTHTQLQALMPQAKPYKKSDRDGLYVEVLPSGAMTWRFQYYLHGKREKVTFGRYPDLGLAEARKRRDEAAALLAAGISPAKTKQESKSEKRAEAARASTFEKLAERWFADDVSGRSQKWQYTIRLWLERDIYPAIGALDPREVTTAHVAKLVDTAVSRGAPASANKLRTICLQIFNYAVDRDELAINPAIKVRRVKTPDSRSHRALAAHEIGPFLEALDAVPSRTVNKLAIRIMLLTLCRKDEVRSAKWSEFDLANAIWEIPAERMKMRRAHRVYLSRQVLELLDELKPLSHGSEFLFPHNSLLRKPIGQTTINYVFDRLDLQGARFVPHGFRATASSILNEANFRPDVIERQLAHKEPNKIRAVYNQAEYADERRRMLQWWADHLDNLRAGANVVPINARRSAA